MDTIHDTWGGGRGKKKKGGRRGKGVYTPISVLAKGNQRRKK